MVHGNAHQPSQAASASYSESLRPPKPLGHSLFWAQSRAVPRVGASPPVNGRQQSAGAKRQRSGCPHDPGHCPQRRGTGKAGPRGASEEERGPSRVTHEEERGCRPGGAPGREHGRAARRTPRRGTRPAPGGPARTPSLAAQSRQTAKHSERTL